MCGIAGIIDYRKSGEALTARAETMRKSMQHRGPDGSGIAVFQNAVLVHTRLAIIDLKGNVQPQYSKNGRWCITYNGEIYNYRNLRKQLEKFWDFQTESDTEVILAAFVKWGSQCLEKFNGMFSFFIWDSQEKTGFAARDRLGVKPFAFSREPHGLVFSSEAKTILKGWDHREATLDKEALVEYLVAPYFSGVETSAFNNIEYLQPGSCLYLDAENFACQKWADYILTDELLEEGYGTEALRSAIQNAIKNTLVSDVPLGTYLSGGFDSTLITALAVRSLKEKPTAYTIHFSDQRDVNYSNSMMIKSDDIPFAKEAAQTFGIKHRIVKPERENLIDRLQKLATTNDALPAWEQEFAQQALAEAASKDYKAVLVGDAADETHFGYPYLQDPAVIRCPSGIINRFGIPPLREDFYPNPVEMLSEKYKALASEAGHRWISPIDCSLATTYIIVKRWLPRLLHNGDIHSMASSLETRVPFADIHLLDLSSRIHPRSGYYRGTEKWLLRQAAKGLIPESIRTRKKSSLPKDQGTGEIYKAAFGKLSPDNLDFLSVFLDMKKITKLCLKEYCPNESERALLFRLLSLCYWREAYKVSI